tara:strand:+ start:191 stop:388 length:198 start_codon:yes stop_codon:yes gene_type:complete
MTTNTTAQEIAEYRQSIQSLLDTIEFMEQGRLAPQMISMITKSANWVLDKHSKKEKSTEIQGELL